MIDVLTNIANRRFFDNQLGIGWKMVVREKTTFAILMIDIDRFKDYYDTYDHQQGGFLLPVPIKRSKRRKIQVETRCAPSEDHTIESERDTKPLRSSR